MSSPEVEALLGVPAEAVAEGASGERTWRYEVPFRFAYLDVFFDAKGRVTEYNYEQF